MSNTKEVTYDAIGQACAQIERFIFRLEQDLEDFKKSNFKETDWLFQDKCKEIEKAKKAIKELRGF